MKSKTAMVIYCGGIFLFVIDRYLKYQALNHWTAADWVVPGVLGWRVFLNGGVAFSLPLPIPLVLLLTAVVIFLLSAGAVHRRGIERSLYIFIILGAASNFVDRFVWRFTVDYYQILTGVFNVADFMIAIGFVGLALTFARKNSS